MAYGVRILACVLIGVTTGVTTKVIAQGLTFNPIIDTFTDPSHPQQKNMVLHISNNTNSNINTVKSKQSSETQWSACGLGQCGNGSYFELRLGRKAVTWENCHYDTMLFFANGQVLAIPGIDVCEYGSGKVVISNQNNQAVAINVTRSPGDLFDKASQSSPVTAHHLSVYAMGC
jgi:ribonuclease HIII